MSSSWMHETVTLVDILDFADTTFFFYFLIPYVNQFLYIEMF